MEFVQFIIDFLLNTSDYLKIWVQDYGVWIYAILFLIIFCETGLVVTPFLPGDSLLFMSGALAAVADNHMNVHVLVLILIVAAVLGDAVNYTIGKFFGEKLFGNPDSKIFKQSYLEKTHNFYEKHGAKTIILARFVPVVRTFAPFVAGMGSMSYKRFAFYNVIGGVAWVTVFTYLGYLFGTIPFVENNLSFIALAIIIISVVPAIVEVLRHKRQSKSSSQSSSK